MKQDTLEGRAKTKNGVIRLCFSVLCILLEAAFIIIVITRLNEYAEIVNLLTRVFAGILVLALYASNQTSSMKMPWIILILVFPIMGVALYLLIGLNGGTPRNYEFDFRYAGKAKTHYALIGMAFVAGDYPLYYDAANEKGLGMAGLNFVGNAAYADEATEADKDLVQVAQYEFIPWILTQCASVAEARRMLSNMKLMGTPFSEQLPTAQLHWMIADKEECIVVESMKDGMHIYDDPVGVLTNNPPFPGQMFALNNYAGVSRKQPESTFAGVLELDPYSRGMGGMGIPGDLSSQSRFVKVAFTKLNAISGDGENESVSQFFHILGSVDQQRGCCEVSEGAYEITIYTSCCNTTKGIYYYTTYDNHQITAVDMYAENLDSDKLIRYPIILNGEIRWHNK